jgi:hypothetical protein
MGKVVAKIKLTNYLDLELKRLKLRREKPRTVQTDALVDTGATRLYLKSSVIRALGLRKEGEIVSKPTNGTRRRSVYQAARLELMGRHGAFQVVEIDDDIPRKGGCLCPDGAAREFPEQRRPRRPPQFPAGRRKCARETVRFLLPPLYFPNSSTLHGVSRFGFADRILFTSSAETLPAFWPKSLRT